MSRIDLIVISALMFTVHTKGLTEEKAQEILFMGG
jgi:hypothetical protein